MWQLSFPYQDTQDRERLSNLPQNEMQQEVLKEIDKMEQKAMTIMTSIQALNIENNNVLDLLSEQLQ